MHESMSNLSSLRVSDIKDIGAFGCGCMLSLHRNAWLWAGDTLVQRSLDGSSGSSMFSFSQPVALHVEHIYHDGTTVFGIGDGRF